MKKIFALLITLSASIAGYAQDGSSLIPKVSGLLKTGFEIDTETGDFSFNVKNARVGLSGLRKISSSSFRYQFQVELNADGKISLLDAYAAFATGDFEISLGQQQYRFGTELNRGPKLNYFSNSSFLGTYIASCYKNANPSDPQSKPLYKNLSARDLGLMVKYNNKTKVPINIIAGLVSGNGINTMVWRNNINFVARAWLDCNTVLGGFGAALNYYTGKTPFGNGMTMAGGELRYMKNRWVVEGEYASRWIYLSEGVDRLDMAAIHAIYRHPVEWGIIEFVSPMARWDYGHNMTVLSPDATLTKFDAQRATAGVTFGFAKKLLDCELRLNYEQYFIADRPAAIADNPQFHNKFIVEFYLAF